MRKIILIGCNGSIGKEIGNSLHNNEYFVIGVDVSEKDDTSSVNDFYSTDLNSPAQISNLCQNIKLQGEIWGLVFAAGIYPVRKFEDYTNDLWDEVMNVNLKSCFLILKEIINQISYGGRIIFITSGASYLGSQDVAYSVSKSGLQGLSRGLAKYFGSKILVNTISPGIIETKMSEKMDEKRKEETVNNTFLKRIGSPAEITSAILFLLDENNSYMTGATIDINGGLYSR